MHMKTKLRHWWTGMMLVSICALPFRVVDAALDWLEPNLVDGYRPLWWRITGTALAFLFLITLPFFVRWVALRIIRTEGFLNSSENEDATRVA